jgi:hypothetical protein
MAEDPSTYQPSTTEVNRARAQGNGVGQQDMDMQVDPDRVTDATEPQRTQGWDNDPPSLGEDRPSEADFSGQDVGESRTFARESSEDGDADPDIGRDEAGVGDAGMLGAGTPANVDIHNIGEQDNPEAEWGEPLTGAVHSSNNTRVGVRTEAQRGQGPRTRQMNKDIVSKRS